MPSTLNVPVPTAQRDIRSFRIYDLLLSVFVVILLVFEPRRPENLRHRAIPHRRNGNRSVLRKRCAVVVSAHLYLGDVFTEVYGYAASRRAVWIAF